MIPKVERIYPAYNNRKFTEQELKNLERKIKPSKVQESKSIINESFLSKLIVEGGILI